MFGSGVHDRTLCFIAISLFDLEVTNDDEEQHNNCVFFLFCFLFLVMLLHK